MLSTSELEIAKSLNEGLANNKVHSCKDLDIGNLHKQNGSCNKSGEGELGKGSPSKNLIDVHEISDASRSFETVKACKSEKPFPPLTEKIWDGVLQLNTSTAMSVNAFFKSGEKVSDIKWSKNLEIKGKVRLKAFESYIQDLPRSRTRAMMVISLCWQDGFSKDGLVALKEVAKNYKENERVGIAQLCPGMDLYVCPRSDAIITLLAKFGFLKGMSAVVEDQDSLIGCVVWRRYLPSISTSKNSEKKRNIKKSSDSCSYATNSTLDTRDRESKECTAIAPSIPDCTPAIPVQQCSKETVSSSVLVKESSNLYSQISQNQPLLSLVLPIVEEAIYRSTKPTSSGSDVAGPPVYNAEQPTSSLDFSRYQQNAANIRQLEPLLPAFSRSEKTSIDAKLPFLPGPPPLPPEVLQRLLQARNNAQNESLGERMVEAETPGIRAVHPSNLGPSSGFALPGPPPLPPEIVKILQITMNANKPREEAVSMAHRPIVLEGEPKNVIAVSQPAAPTLVRPRFLPHPIDGLDDDLPEYDFGRTTIQSSKMPLNTSSYHNKLTGVAQISRAPVPPSLSLSYGSEARKQPLESLTFEDCSSRRKNWVNNDDEDMPEWFPPDQRLSKHIRTHSITDELLADFPILPPFPDGILGKRPSAAEPAVPKSYSLPDSNHSMPKISCSDRFCSDQNKFRRPRGGNWKQRKL